MNWQDDKREATENKEEIQDDNSGGSFLRLMHFGSVQKDRYANNRSVLYDAGKTLATIERVSICII